MARRLTAAGLEIEGQSEFGAGTNELRIARVQSLEPHPSKSGLRLVTVEHGQGTQRIVCGAPNVPPPGGLVVLAFSWCCATGLEWVLARRRADAGALVEEPVEALEPA